MIKCAQLLMSFSPKPATTFPTQLRHSFILAHMQSPHHCQTNPTPPTYLLMGVILSVVAIATNSIKKSRDKKKAKKNAQAQSTPAATSNPQQPYSEQQHAAVKGLRDEHLASAPPQTEASHVVPPQVEAKVERDVAVGAPLPVS
jgi:hypothetical protein